MNRVPIYSWLVLSLIFWLSCNSQAQPKEITAKPVKKTFSLPDIPPLLTTPEERATYLAEHYWQNFDFTDTTFISRPEITEQALADFLDILPLLSSGNTEKALITLMSSASADSAMFTHFIGLMEKYLYDPNSPFRNEEYYIPVLRYITASHKLNEMQKVHPQYLLYIVLKNRLGMISTDFVYTLPNGKTEHMKDINADYTLLFFNNPDCPNCKQVKEAMATSQILNQMTGNKKENHPSVAVLAVYPDSDTTLWKKTSYPAFMINSYDAGSIITQQQLYDLKAIPTLYLLDKNKRVILKDTSVEQIEAFLQELNR